MQSNLRVLKQLNRCHWPRCSAQLLQHQMFLLVRNLSVLPPMWSWLEFDRWVSSKLCNLPMFLTCWFISWQLYFSCLINEAAFSTGILFGADHELEIMHWSCLLRQTRFQDSCVLDLYYALRWMVGCHALVLSRPGQLISPCQNDGARLSIPAGANWLLTAPKPILPFLWRPLPNGKHRSANQPVIASLSYHWPIVQLQLLSEAGSCILDTSPGLKLAQVKVIPILQMVKLCYHANSEM